VEFRILKRYRGHPPEWATLGPLEWGNPTYRFSVFREGYVGHQRGHPPFHSIRESFHRDRAFGFLLAADADVDLAGFHFFIADD
jgi:hypothetical protein